MLQTFLRQLYRSLYQRRKNHTMHVISSPRKNFYNKIRNPIEKLQQKIIFTELYLNILHIKKVQLVQNQSRHLGDSSRKVVYHG